MPLKTFDIFTLRFERIVDGRTAVVDLQPSKLPVIPGVDWDLGRDVNLTFADPTSCLAVIAPGSTRLVIQARVVEMPSNQSWTISAADPSASSVLPTVDPRTYRERFPGCISRELTFEADATRIAERGVGRYEITWNWVGRLNDSDGKQGEARDLGTTRFVVFAIVGAPVRAPWRPASMSDPDRDLLRAEVLDVACRASESALSFESAGAGVARTFFDLGSEDRQQSGKRVFVYGDVDDLACDQEHHLFQLQRFLRALNEPAGLIPVPVSVSCEDLATAVCVFANALGLDLERRMISMPETTLSLARVKRIGLKPDIPTNWSTHVVAWSPTSGGVFDACLQLDMSERKGVEQWETPGGMPFGEATRPQDRAYRHRLLTKGADVCQFDAMRAPTLDRASVKPFGIQGIVARLQDAYLRRLAAVTRPLAELKVPLDADGLQPPLGFVLEASSSRGWLTTAVWRGSQARGRYLRLTSEWAADRQSTFELAAWRLTFYRELMEARTDPNFPGAIYFATANEQRVLIVYANAVVRLRGDGIEPVIPGPALGPVLTPVVVQPV